MHANDKSVNVLPMQNTFLDDNIALDVMKMENDHLMKLLVSQDLVHTAINSLAAIHDYKSMEKSYIDEYERNLKLTAEISQMNELLKTCSKLEQRLELHQLTRGYISLGLVQNPVSSTPYVPPSKKDYEILFQPLFNEYFNPPPRTVSPNLVVVAAPRAVDPAGSHPSSKDTTLHGVIPSNLHHLNQSFDTLTKLTNNNPLENVIGDPSRPVLTRRQLHEHAIWCYSYANDNPIPFDGKRSG
nr:hypothetical protein [Tanacetum cinerariifolium]